PLSVPAASRRSPPRQTLGAESPGPSLRARRAARALSRREDRPDASRSAARHGVDGEPRYGAAQGVQRPRGADRDRRRLGEPLGRRARSVPLGAGSRACRPVPRRRVRRYREPAARDDRAHLRFPRLAADRRSARRDDALPRSESEEQARRAPLLARGIRPRSRRRARALPPVLRAFRRPRADLAQPGDGSISAARRPPAPARESRAAVP